MMKMPTVKIDYYPHDAQMPFHLDRYKVKYRGLIAGTGSGKTRAGTKEALDWAWENPGSVGLIAAPAFRKFREIIIPAFENLLGIPTENISSLTDDEKLSDSLLLNKLKIDTSPFFTRFNRMEMSLDVFNGSKIWMIGLDKPEAAEGMNIDWAWVDEGRLVPKFGDAWNSIRRRLRGSGLAKPLDAQVPENAVGAWVTTTPDAPGSDLHKFFEGREKDPDAQVYRMSIDDNPFLTEEFIEGIKRSHTGGFYDRFVLGRFATVAGGAFPFDYAIHVQNFEHMFKKENIKRWVYGVDFGWTNPAAIHPLGFDGDDRAFVVDEIYRSRMTSQVIISECVALQEKWGNGIFWCDSSEPQTIAEMKRAGLDARPNKSKRDDGIREMGGRFKDAGDGRRRIYISPRCVNFIDELQTYDPTKKERDHAIDDVRYGLMGAKRVSGDIQVEAGWRPRPAKKRR